MRPCQSRHGRFRTGCFDFTLLVYTLIPGEKKRIAFAGLPIEGSILVQFSAIFNRVRDKICNTVTCKTSSGMMSSKNEMRASHTKDQSLHPRARFENFGIFLIIFPLSFHISFRLNHATSFCDAIHRSLHE